MSYLRVIERLEDMLRTALEIIDEQSKLFHQHGIETDSGKLEADEQKFREDVVLNYQTEKRRLKMPALFSWKEWSLC